MDEELLKKLGLSIARGVPQMATGFVDLAGMPFTATGLLEPEEVVGSTAYLTQMGLLPPPQEGVIPETIEMLSGSLSPQGAATGGLLALGTMAGAKGGKAVNQAFKTAQDEAMEIAQRNAALPVEQGGLGLPVDNTAMDRAKAMGADVSIHSSKQSISEAPLIDYYHATGRNQTAFPSVSQGYNTTTFTEPTQINRYASFFAKNPEPTESFAKQYSEGGNVLPVNIKSGKVLDLTEGITEDIAKELGLPSSAKFLDKTQVWQIFDGDIGKKTTDNMRKKGYTAADLVEVNAETGDVFESVAVIDPSAVRSKFAAFDPMRRNEPDLLASILAGLGLGGLLSLEEEQY